MFGVRAERLVVEGGWVVGVSAQRLDDGTHLYARATRGVVLATGGYRAGHLLRQRYQPARDAQSPYYGTSNCGGDGHVMGAAVGADLVNMTYLPPTVLAASTVVETELAAALDIPVGALEATAGQWNTFLASGAQAKPDLADSGSVRSGSSVVAEAEAIKDLAAL